MTSRRAVVGLFVAHLIAAGALAQDASEFGRVSAGEVELLAKQTRKLSGSMGFSMSSGLKGYGATLGGTLLQDRLWFFASAQRNDVRLTTGVAQMELPQRGVAGAVDAKLMGQLGDHQSFDAFFETARQPMGTTPDAFNRVTPSSFLSLRYTGVVSSNMFFNASFSQRSLQ